MRSSDAKGGNNRAIVGVNVTAIGHFARRSGRTLFLRFSMRGSPRAILDAAAAGERDGCNFSDTPGRTAVYFNSTTPVR